MACAVCARVLDIRDSPVFGLTYTHTLADSPADHPPVPVPLDQVRVANRCDFCHAESPGWVLPARNFQAGHMSGSVEGWAACDTCAELLTRNQWTQLRRRVLAALLTAHPEHATADRSALEAELARLYRKLRANVTGAVRPIQPPLPP